VFIFCGFVSCRTSLSELIEWLTSSSEQICAFSMVIIQGLCKFLDRECHLLLVVIIADHRLPGTPLGVAYPAGSIDDADGLFTTVLLMTFDSLYVFAVFFVKFSVIRTYSRAFFKQESRFHRWHVVPALHALVSTWLVGTIFHIVHACRPFASVQKSTNDGICYGMDVLYDVCAAIDILTTVVLSLVPLKSIITWTKRLERHRCEQAGAAVMVFLGLLSVTFVFPISVKA
jgi:hypothetical protein